MAQGTLPDRTREFADFVTRAKGKEYQAMHPSKLTFQSLRVHLNQVLCVCIYIMHLCMCVCVRESVCVYVGVSKSASV